MKKEGFGKGNWGTEKPVYKKKGEADPVIEDEDR
jgi:hypothetical protein